MKEIQYITDILSISSEQQHESFLEFMRWIITVHPQKVAWMLYRLDVDEQELKKRIAEAPMQEAEILTAMVTEKLSHLAKQKQNLDESPDWSFDLD